MTPRLTPTDTVRHIDGREGIVEAVQPGGMPPMVTVRWMDGEVETVPLGMVEGIPAFGSTT